MSSNPERKGIGSQAGLVVTAGLRPAETRIAEHRLHVLVPGDQPRGFAVRHAHQAQRLVLLQVTVQRVQVQSRIHPEGV
jgi:hypothetical protein